MCVSERERQRINVRNIWKSYFNERNKLFLIRCPRGVVAYRLNYNIVVSVFALTSRYWIQNNVNLYIYREREMYGCVRGQIANKRILSSAFFDGVGVSGEFLCFWTNTIGKIHFIQQWFKNTTAVIRLMRRIIAKGL